MSLSLDLIFSFLQDKLPNDDIAVPFTELPDPEADNGNTGESLREQVSRYITNKVTKHTFKQSHKQPKKPAAKIFLKYHLVNWYHPLLQENKWSDTGLANITTETAAQASQNN